MNECLFYFPYIHRTIFSSWPFLSLRWILSKWPQLEQLTFIHFSGQPTDTTPSRVGAERPSCLVSETNPLWSIHCWAGNLSQKGEVKLQLNKSLSTQQPASALPWNILLGKYFHPENTCTPPLPYTQALRAGKGWKARKWVRWGEESRLLRSGSSLTPRNISLSNNNSSYLSSNLSSLFVWTHLILPRAL